MGTVNKSELFSVNRLLDSNHGRRGFLCMALAGCAGVVVSSCKEGSVVGTQKENPPKEEPAKGGEVTATEDLMREHGVLRRALLVFSEAAVRLRNAPKTVSPEALQQTASLFRAFGEDYHEKMLEEAYIFPAVKGSAGSAAALPDILTSQHRRGREITDYILATTKDAGAMAGNAGHLAGVLDSFVRMYRAHAAREDTVVFPAWKQTLSARQLDEIGDKFEEIERQQLGEDGYEHAVLRIGEIEQTLGLADLAGFTAPPPTA